MNINLTFFPRTKTANLKFVYVIIILILVSCQNTNNESDNYKDYFMPSYKEIKSENPEKNKFSVFFDSISNMYSNYKYGFSMQFPDNWSIDKGFSEHTIIRGIEKDSAITFSINVIQLNDLKYDDFSLWNYFDSQKNSIEINFKKEAENALQSKIYKYFVEKVIFDNHEALKREYIYNVKHLDIEYQMKSVMYQIAKPPYIYTLGLQMPAFFYERDPQKYNNIVNSFYFINTKKID